MEESAFRPPRPPLRIGNLFDPYKLLYWREKRGLTQEQLAYRIGHKNRQQISAWENALFRVKPKSPSRANVLMLSIALDIDVASITSSEDELRLSMIAHDQYRRRRRECTDKCAHPTRAIWHEVMRDIKKEIERGDHG